MKFQFRLSEKEGLKELQEDWLMFLFKFFEEKVVFQSSQIAFLAFLDPHIIESHECSRVLLFAHNRRESPKVFESSISVGLLQGKSISKIKHAPPLRFAVLPKQLVCVEFPLKGDNTPRGKYKIRMNTKECRSQVKRLAEKFSICSISDFVSTFAHTGTLGQTVTRWALHKLKNRKVQVSKADILSLGIFSGIQETTQYMGVIIEDKMDYTEKIDSIIDRDAWKTPLGTALSGVADGVLSEMFDMSLPSLTLTVV